MNVEIDTTKVDAALESAPKKASIAILRAVKRGTKAAKTKAARVISKDFKIKSSEVSHRIRLIPPTGQTFTGELRADLKRIPLIAFGAQGPEPSRGRGRGVTYRGKRGRSRLPHAFIATMPSGHRGVFKRRGTTRLHIDQLYGPSIGLGFIEHEGEILKRGEEVVTAELDRLLDRMLG